MIALRQVTLQRGAEPLFELISETVIYDLATNQAKNIAVREFSAVTEASGCAVNDDTKTLYVGEAELGVWAINADAESDANKQPVALVQPYGELKTEIGALSVSQDGTLWLSATDDSMVYAYQAQTDTLSQWSLAGEHTIESVAASFINDNQAQLVSKGFSNPRKGNTKCLTSEFRVTTCTNHQK